MHNKPVRCVETGEVFDSMRAAAAWASLMPYDVSSAVRGEQKTAGGYHWEYARDEDVPPKEPPKKPARPRRSIYEMQEEARRQTELTGRLVQYSDLQKQETLEKLERERRASK